MLSCDAPTQGQSPQGCRPDLGTTACLCAGLLGTGLANLQITTFIRARLTRGCLGRAPRTAPKRPALLVAVVCPGAGRRGSAVGRGAESSEETALSASARMSAAPRPRRRPTRAAALVAAMVALVAGALLAAGAAAVRSARGEARRTRRCVRMHTQHEHSSCSALRGVYTNTGVWFVAKLRF